MVNWLRNNRWASYLLAVIRIYLGWGFLHAGWEKLTNTKGFDASGFLANAVSNPVTISHTTTPQYPAYHAFLANFALPNANLFNFLIPWGEFLVGLGLILGTLTTAAALFGLIMNFSYLFAGTISVNPWDILLGVILLFAGYNAGKIGGDIYAIPWIRNLFSKIKFHKESNFSIH